MSLDKLRIPKLSDSSRKNYTEETKEINECSFCGKNQKDMDQEGGEGFRRNGVTRKQKVYEDKRTRLEVEVYRSPAQVENQVGLGTEGNWFRILPSESTPVEQGHDFATSAGTFD